MTFICFRPSRRLRHAFGCVSAVAAVVTSATAAFAQTTVTWNGSTDATWTQPDSTSWSGATYQSGYTAVFSGSGTGTVTIDAGGVTPGQVNVTSGSYTFSGGGIGGSGGIAKSGSGTLTLTGSNTYSGTTSVTAGVLNVQNATALGGTTAGTTVSSGAALQLQGGIAVANESLSIGGAGVSGTGALRNISGENEWSGAITVTGLTTVNPSTLIGALTTIRSDANNLVISGNVALPTGTFDGTTGTGGGVIVNGDGDAEISGNITGGNDGVLAFARNATGAGTWTLSGTNTYLGFTAINTYEVIAAGGSAIPDTSLTYLMSTGTLTLQASETIAALTSNSSSSVVSLGGHTLTVAGSDPNPVDPNGQSTFIGSITGTGGLAKSGAGTLTLSAANAYEGGTTVSDGRLVVGSSGSLGTGSLTLSGGTLDLQSSLAVSGLSGSGGTITGGTAGSFTLTVTTAAGSSSYAGTISDGSATAVSLTKAGAGTLTLAGGNAYSGATSVTGGVLVIENAAALGGTAGGTSVSTGAALGLQGGITVTGESLTISGDGVAATSALRNISGTNTWAGSVAATRLDTVNLSNGVGALNRIQSDASSHLEVAGPISIATGTFNGATGTSAALLVAGDGSGEISGSITGGVAGAMTFARSSFGAGTWTLSGSNTYLGHTAINGNPLVVAGGSAIPDTSLVYFLAAGSLTLQASETIGSLTSDSQNASINLNSHTLTIGADNSTPVAPGGATTYLGSIVGTGGIVKVGTGLLTLDRPAAYSGSTVVKGGTLALGALGTVADSPTITIGDIGSSGAVLDISAKTGTFTFVGSQTVGGIGTLKVGDTAEFAGTFAPGNSAGVFTLDGGTTLLSGTTEIEILGSGRGTGYDAVDLVNSAALDYGSGVLALDFGSSLAAEQSYQIFGDGAQAILGSFSSLTLSGSNYTGLTFTKDAGTGVWTSTGTSLSNQTLTFTEGTGTLVIVPEPAVNVLAGLAAAVAAWAARRSTGRRSTIRDGSRFRDPHEGSALS